MRRFRGLRASPAAAASWLGAATAVVPAAAPAAAGAAWAAAAVAVATVVLLRRRQRLRTAAVVAAMSFALAAAAASHVALAQPSRDALSVEAFDGGRAVVAVVAVTGKVESWGDAAWAFDARLKEIRAGSTTHALATPVSVQVPAAILSGLDVDVSAVLQVHGTLRASRAGERAVAIIDAREVALLGAPNGAAGAAGALREGLVALASGFPGDGAGLLAGLAVGDTAKVSADLDDAMRVASLSHLTAVSGANCAVVVGLAYAGAAALGCGRRGRAVAALLVLGGFVILVTPEPSVVRAATMAAIAMFALLRGRTSQGLAVLSLAVAGALVFDPWLAASLGFALSVTATAALLLLAPPLGRGLERVLPRALSLALAVPLSAQLACGPLLILVEPSIPVFGVAANLLAAPAAPLATVAGLAACLCAAIPGLGWLFTAAAWVPASWIAATAHAVADLPAHTLPWIDGVPGAVLLATLGAAGVLVLFLGGGPRVRHVRAVCLVVLAVLVGVGLGRAALTTVAAPATVPVDWVVLVCDVGQGDAVLLRSAGAVALVDTGPSPEDLAVCLRRAGISRIDLLVLTHFDADHSGGAAAVEGRVGTLLHGAPDADGAATIAQLTAAGARAVPAYTGVHGELGAATWRVLWPQPASAAFPVGNDASVVLDIRGGGIPATLLLGDLSASPQRALRAGPALRPPYAIVKVAHHGSADQHDELYRSVDARVALITVGAGNGYGHPRPEILALLDALGARIVRTDRDGMVAISVAATGTGVRLWRERTATVGPAD